MNKLTSSVILLIASVIWGAAFVAQKAAVVIPPFTVVAIRSLFAVLFLIPIILICDKLLGTRRLIRIRGGFRIDISRRELAGGAVSGIFLFAASALQQAGLATTDAGKASFITALYVIIVPVFALALGKRSSINIWISAIIAIIGFYFLSIADGFSIAIGDLLMLGSAFVFAMQIMSIDRFMPGSDAFRFSAVQFASCGTLSAVFSLIFEPLTPLSAVASVLPSLLYLGICSSGIAYTFQTIGQKNTPAPIATLLMSLESVFGALFAALLIGERLSSREYIGCAVVFFAVLFAEFEPINLIKNALTKRKSKEQENN